MFPNPNIPTPIQMRAMFSFKIVNNKNTHIKFIIKKLKQNMNLSMSSGYGHPIGT